MKNSKRMQVIPAIAVIASLVVPWTALADEIYADGDGITPVGQHNLAFGTVCQGDSVDGTVLLAISRNAKKANSGKVFADASTVLVTVDSKSGDGLGADDPATTVMLPLDWVLNGTMSDATSSKVTLDTTGPVYLLAITAGMCYSRAQVQTPTVTLILMPISSTSTLP
jgi:hypothetical protein